MNSWRCFAASAVGKGHLDTGQPCQDAFTYEIDGERLYAVVCDGAGSAKYGAEGASHFAEVVIKSICGVDIDRLTHSDFPWVEHLADLRDSLAELAKRDHAPVREFACTLLGIAATHDRGVLFHIGDGIGIVEIDSAEPTISPPENGQYSNETWFVTGADWIEHLRITTFHGRILRLALMSDGSMPFVLDRSQRAFFPAFVEPVCAYLSEVGATDGNDALQATLSNPATHEITADDKTLLIAWPSQE